MNIQIKPLHNRVLVKLDKNPEMVKSAGGIYMPDSVKESPVMIGTVVAVGDGEYVEGGMFITPKAMIGDRVLFGKYAGANIDEPMGFENYMIVRDPDILAIIQETAITEEPENTAAGSDYGVNVAEDIPSDDKQPKEDDK